MKDVARLTVEGVALACVAAAAAMVLTPAPGTTAAAGMAGWPRLALYALGGTILGLSVPGVCPRPAARASPAPRRAYLLLGVGAVASLGVTALEVVLLQRNIADPLGPALWVISMLLVFGYTLFPLVQRLEWPAAWAPPSSDSPTGRRRLLAVLLLVSLVVVSAALRLAALGEVPRGINPDEGDRAISALDVLSGDAPSSWFDSGWFFINMVYFRLLATSFQIFGPDVVGGRMLSALAGVGFVATIAWFGYRNFGWRVALLATALAAAMGMTLQHSRLIAESGLTGLLWAVSIGSFLEGARTGRAWAWALAGLSGGLSLYFYPSARLWAVGAVLTVVVLWLLQRRDFRLSVGVGVAAVAALVASAPFLVHLSTHHDEIAGRYAQTAVFDPNNQVRLSYLAPPEPLPKLIALQAERTLGMFDRYPDGGGFLIYPTPVFRAPLAALTLLGAIYCLVRAWRDPRLAVLSIWFWLGLSGVALTVETPDYIRAVGMLPSLCFVIAVPVLDVVDRVLKWLLASRTSMAGVLAGGAAGVVALALAVPEATMYFSTFRTMPGAWGPMNREGQVVAELGANGPVYSIEMNEHLVISGWVRVLSPRSSRGRLPNPGRELPILAVPGSLGSDAALRPGVVPGEGQGLSVVMAPDTNQRPYAEFLLGLYPEGVLADAGDGRRSFVVSPAGLASTRGVTVVGPDGAWTAAVEAFGEVPNGVRLPARLTWRAGVRLPRGGTYRVEATAPPGAQLRLDEIPLGDRSADVVAAQGLHFLQLTAEVASADQRLAIALGEPGESPRELGPTATYRPMDAPWGLLARVGRRSRQRSAGPADAFLDATVAMAFFQPELGHVAAPDTITWTGSLLAPRGGTYRMAFAAEDAMHLELDGEPIDVVTVRPQDWPNVGTGSQVTISEGAHAVRVTLEVTHDGRELARWNWVPPTPTGAPDTAAEWLVVPPHVLRPDQPVKLLSSPVR